MKKRLLTALFGLSFAVGWLFTMYTPAYSIIMGAFAVMAEYEMLKVFGVKNIPFKALCLILSGGILLYADYRDRFQLPFFAVATGVVLLSLVIMVLDFERLKFEQVVCSLFSAFAVSSALSCVVLFRDVYKAFPDLYTKADGVFYILFAFFCAWFTDGFALFAGMALGKHKLAPKISPKKTVEGAVGGVIGGIGTCVALYYVFKLKFGLSEHITLPYVILSALFLSVLSIFGDLAASTIKRHHGVKDFGNLLPGHGGVMDRFDSSVFVFSALYGIITVAAKFM
jgi:phosphatidate cytidylyltransferase